MKDRMVIKIGLVLSALVILFFIFKSLNVKSGHDVEIIDTPIVAINYYNKSIEDQDRILEDNQNRSISIDILQKEYPGLGRALLVINKENYNVADINIIKSVDRDMALNSVDFSSDTREKNKDIFSVLENDSFKLFAQTNKNKDYSIYLISTNTGRDIVELQINDSYYQARRIDKGLYRINSYHSEENSLIGLMAIDEKVSLEQLFLITQENKDSILNSNRLTSNLSDKIVDKSNHRLNVVGLNGKYLVVATSIGNTIKAINTTNDFTGKKIIRANSYLNDRGFVFFSQTSDSDLNIIKSDGEYEIEKSIDYKVILKVILLILLYFSLVFILIFNKLFLKYYGRIKKLFVSYLGIIKGSISKRSAELIIYILFLLFSVLIKMTFSIGTNITTSYLFILPMIFYLIFFRFSLKSVYIMLMVFIILMSLIYYSGYNSISEKVGYVVYGLLIIFIISLLIENFKKVKRSHTN